MKEKYLEYSRTLFNICMYYLIDQSYFDPFFYLTGYLSKYGGIGIIFNVFIVILFILNELFSEKILFNRKQSEKKP